MGTGVGCTDHYLVAFQLHKSTKSGKEVGLELFRATQPRSMSAAAHVKNPHCQLPEQSHYHFSYLAIANFQQDILNLCVCKAPRLLVDKKKKLSIVISTSGLHPDLKHKMATCPK